MKLLTKRSFPYTWTSGRQPVPNEPVIWDPKHAEEFGLVGAWVFNGLLPLDLSPYGNHPALVGDSFGVRATPHGVALDSAGDNNNHRLNLGSISSANKLSLNQGNSATFAVRLRYDGSPGSAFPRIIDKSDGGSAANGWAIYVNTNTSSLIHIAANNNQYRSSVLPTAGAYESWAFRRNGSNGNWFRDGVDATGSSFNKNSSNYPSTTTNAAIGNWNHTTDRNWAGLIEYVFVFDQPMPDEDIFALQRDPYRYIVPAPARQLIFIPGAPPPPSPDFNPAWAMLANQ